MFTLMAAWKATANAPFTPDTVSNTQQTRTYSPRSRRPLKPVSSSARTPHKTIADALDTLAD
eukprot:1232017-Amphidinium_carterae.1